MTEAEWLTCTEPEPMRQFVCDKGSERKRLLYMVAWILCSKSAALDRRSRVVVEVAERYADGLATYEDLHPAGGVAFLVKFIPILMGGHCKADHPEYAQLLRDVIVNPFRPVAIPPALLAWRDGLPVRLAQAAYEERHLPASTLDNGRLAVLADALEEAGCTSEEILGHLRGPEPHVQGCWVVDSILGRL